MNKKTDLILSLIFCVFCGTMAVWNWKVSFNTDHEQLMNTIDSWGYFLAGLITVNYVIKVVENIKEK